jgi:hypothetical protein
MRSIWYYALESISEIGEIPHDTRIMYIDYGISATLYKDLLFLFNELENSPHSVSIYRERNSLIDRYNFIIKHNYPIIRS